MQRKNMVVKKFVAILIVFLLTLSEFSPLMTSYVWALEDVKDNVEFKGYFSSESAENASSFVCDVQESTLKLNFEIKVTDKGYLKSGVLKFGDNLNFSVKEETELQIKDNQIKVKTIAQNESELISIPIEFKRDEKLNSSYLNATNKITFSGVYVDNDAVEHIINKTIDLNLSWKESTSTKIDNSLEKNIDYEIDGKKGKIVQSVVKVYGNNGDNKLPVKNSELRIDVPLIAGMELKTVHVEANKLCYTQGREDYDLEFSDENYKLEEQKLIISVPNNEKDGKIFNSYGEDEYTITYMYVGEKENERRVSGNIEFSLTTYAGEKESQTINCEYNLGEAIGDTVAYTRDDRESLISKGYLMANCEAEKYEITYTKKDVLNISRADLVSSLEIVDQEEFFVENGDSHIYYTDDDESQMSTYVSTKFSRDNLVNVLGEDGKVEILNMNDEVIHSLTFGLEADENGAYVVAYDEPISKVKIRTSKPISDGTISILSTKVIKKLNYSRNLVKDFYKLVSTSKGFVTYNEGAVDELGLAESIVMINPTTSNASLEVSQTELSTTVKNEGVNFKIRLNNNEDMSDLYENPVFEVKLPKAIKEVFIKNIDLFYANDELQIANVETLKGEENLIIRITLSGVQTSYNLNKETNGTIISFDLDLTVDEFTGNISENVEMCYYNASSVKYENEIDWNMLMSQDNVSYFMNGLYIVPVSYKAPEGLVNGQTTVTKDEENSEENNSENTDKVVSVEQGAQSELISEGAPAKLATMNIEIMNNTSKRYSNFKILGRIPFKGNKDIITGEDLGTTVDTILDSVVRSENSDLLYTVYYSENSEATEDIYNEANGWKTNFYKMGGVKSYLIVLNSDYVLEPDQRLAFSYDYMIPANLVNGDAFFGTYATYYQEADGEAISNSSADKIGYETAKKAEVEASIGVVDSKIKELSDVKFEVALKNVSDIDAKNVNVEFDLPEEIEVKTIEGKNVSGMYDAGKVSIVLPELRANAEEKIIIKCVVNRFLAEENKVKLNAIVFGDNLKEQIQIESSEYDVEKTKVMIKDEMLDVKRVAGNESLNVMVVTNVSEQEFNNVKITKKLGENYSFVSSVIDTDLNVTESYNADTHEVTWVIESFKPEDSINIKYVVLVNFLENGVSENINIVETKYDLNDGSEPIVNQEKTLFYQPEIYIAKTNSKELGYAVAGDKVTYVYELKNNSTYDIPSLRVLPTISENAKIDLVTIRTAEGEKYYLGNSLGTILEYIPAGMDVTIIVDASINNDAKGYVSTGIEVKVGKSYSSKQNIYTVLENDNNGDLSYELTGCAYIDENKNQFQDDSEEVLPGVIVELYNSETNERVNSVITDISGRYTFRGLENGKYYAKFNYDDSEYLLSTEVSDTMVQNKASVININDSYITDNISIDSRSVSSVDLGLVEDNIYDMKIDMTVERMTVQNSAESKTFDFLNSKLAKVDIDPKLVGESKVYIEYEIVVMNQGTIPGKVNKLVNYMTEGLEFESELNPDWYIEADGNLYTRALRNQVINPGESRELKLVLVKNMTETNTGLVHNSVEIADAINDKGILDCDSVYGNQLDEDDLSCADCIVGVSTGKIAVILPIVLISVIILIPLIVLVWRIIEKRRYV